MHKNTVEKFSAMNDKYRVLKFRRGGGRRLYDFPPRCTASRHVVCIETRLAMRIAGVLWNVARRRCRRLPVFGPMPDQRLSDNPKTSTGRLPNDVYMYFRLGSFSPSRTPSPIFTPLNRYRQTLTFRGKEREKKAKIMREKETTRERERP